MSAASKVLLILGSGPNVGKSVAQAFIAKGYKVAHTSRKSRPENDTADEINLAADFSNPESLPQVFSQVREKLGIPSVVVYNGRSSSLYSMGLVNLTVVQRLPSQPTILKIPCLSLSPPSPKSWPSTSPAFT
jgi:NAD(P)-dependent dehydrogenase (short-subunit alcohol dehydrogenase family)